MVAAASCLSYNKPCYFQVYKAGKKPAVDRLCLGIPRGEVRNVTLFFLSLILCYIFLKKYLKLLYKVSIL